MTDIIYTNVDQYLAALKNALAGAPPGMIADALADCEEHLRGAIAAHPDKSEAEVFADMARSYGSPEEVAAEYRAIEMPKPGPFSRPGMVEPVALPRRPWTFFNVASDPATYGALIYMLLTLVTGVTYFVWATTGVALSAGLAVLVIGIPFFLLFIGSVRLLSYVEGRIVETLLGVRMPRRLPAALQETGFFARVKAALVDLRTWSSLLYMFLMLPLGIGYFVIALVGVVVPGALTVGGLWNVIDRGSHIQVDDGPQWVLNAVHNPLAGILCAAIGVMLFFVSLHLVRAIGWLHGRIAEHLLVRL